MSVLKLNTAQLGQSVTASNNFIITTPTVADGSLKLSRGSVDSVVADVLTVDAAGAVNVVGALSTGDIAVGKMTLSEAITLSGTAVDIDTVPSWAKRITLNIADLSLSGTAQPMVKFKVNGVVDSLGYKGSVDLFTTTVAPSLLSTGFAITDAAGLAADVIQGVFVFTKLSDSVWMCSFTGGRSQTAGLILTGGSKTIAGTLTGLQVTSLGGTNTFDGGVVSVLYEG